MKTNIKEENLKTT